MLCVTLQSSICEWVIIHRTVTSTPHHPVHVWTFFYFRIVGVGTDCEGGGKGGRALHNVPDRFSSRDQEDEKNKDEYLIPRKQIGNPNLLLVVGGWFCPTGFFLNREMPKTYPSILGIHSPPPNQTNLVTGILSLSFHFIHVCELVSWLVD
ncbi:unnamed protein product [Periconia digitata]|uniref:Uncharacterized protein n=1 Tax=Periconia digitata TaxID=1303443 RepID=A0A9W4XUP7_9PLEO|nr:unnamed protein product [Periconia digitata]